MKKNKIGKTSKQFYNELDNKTTLSGKPSCLGMAIILLVLIIIAFLVFSYFYLFK